VGATKGIKRRNPSAIVCHYNDGFDELSFDLFTPWPRSFRSNTSLNMAATTEVRSRM